jgi:CubicO group peptidase (beta-lactamase class C family)
MALTTFRPTVAMTYPLSQGHDAAAGAKPTVIRPFVNNVRDWSAGFAYSNVSDLARSAAAFMDGGRIDGRQVIPPSAVSTLSTPYVEVPFSWDIPPGFYEGAKYRHGLFITEYRGVRVLHHGGVINGFGAFVLMAPEHRVAVILLADRTGSILGKSLEKAMKLSLPLRPKPTARRRRVVPMIPAEMGATSARTRTACSGLSCSPGAESCSLRITTHPWPRKGRVVPSKRRSRRSGRIGSRSPPRERPRRPSSSSCSAPAAGRSTCTA